MEPDYAGLKEREEWKFPAGFEQVFEAHEAQTSPLVLGNDSLCLQEFWGLMWISEGKAM